MGEQGSAARRAELSYTSATSDTPLLGDTIGANFDRTVAMFPARLALVDVPAGLRYTYAELKAGVDALAYALLQAGIAAGDRVGIWSPNRAEWTVTQYATAKIGAILVNINPAYRTSELEFVLNQSGCKLLIAARRLKTSDYAAMIAEVRPRCADLEQVVLLDSDAWRELLETGKDPDTSIRTAELEAIRLSADDPINIQYTSGTTGFPKGATLSHHNILNNGFFVGELCHYTEQDKICIPVPFYHCFGMVMGNLAATSHGAAMIIPAPAFDPVRTLEAVSSERCTSLYGVPTMFIAELAVPGIGEYDLSSLRTGGSRSWPACLLPSPLPPAATPWSRRRSSRAPPPWPSACSTATSTCGTPRPSRPPKSSTPRSRDRGRERGGVRAGRHPGRRRRQRRRLPLAHQELEPSSQPGEVED